MKEYLLYRRTLMWTAVLVVALLLLASAPAIAIRAVAQNNAFSLPWSSINSGGAVKQSGQTFIVQNTTGQSAIGRSSSKSFNLSSGFQATAPTQLGTEADLSVTKSDIADPVMPGGRLIYTVNVANGGPSNASGVVVTDTLPVEVKFVTAGNGCVESDGNVICNVGELSAGANVVIAIEVSIDSSVANGTIITNAVSVHGNESDPRPQNNVATEDTTVGSLPGPVLEVSDLIPAIFGNAVTVPVYLHTGGRDVASIAFSLDFDETNLSFDTTDANGDGVPDSINLVTPAAFVSGVSADLSDTDGELDFYIFDPSFPISSLGDGVLAEITFRAKTDPGSGNSVLAPLIFSGDPLTTFGNSTGTNVPGSTDNGSVVISGVTFGDCNRDGVVSSADTTAVVLEIFDGDGTSPGDAHLGTFQGTAGCDSNEDGSISAADITCVVLIIFNGPEACNGGEAALGRSDAESSERGSTAVTVPEHLDGFRRGPRIG